jgi:TolB-like protein
MFTKKIITRTFLFILILLTPYIYAETYTISNATDDIGRKINLSSFIYKGSTLAIVNIKSLSVELTNHIITLIETSILNGDNIRIVSRNRIDEAHGEIDFSLTGLIDDNTAQKIGYFLGAKYVLTGDLSKIENKYILSVQVLETETGEIKYSNQYEIRNTELRYYERLIAEKEKTERQQRELLVKQENERQQEAIKKEKQEQRQKIQRAPKHIENDFINGFYLGYNYSPVAPFGFSLGYIADGFGWYLDTEFAFPNFEGYSSDTTYKYDGNERIYGFSSYNYQDKSTAFIWEEFAGITYPLFVPYIWFSGGVGIHLEIQYLLFTEYDSSYYSIRGTNYGDKGTKWYGPESPKFDFALQAGLIFKYRHISISTKYKYIINTGSNFDVGIAYVWKWQN